MKKIAVGLFAALFALSSFAGIAEAKGSKGGHYRGGHGSSHKGGKYVNPKTGNHYTHKK